MSPARARSRTLRLPLLPALAPILAALLAAVLLVTIYRAPYSSIYQVGSWIASAEQMYDIEESGGLTYTFTRGAAALHFPELGNASYAVALEVAGPGGKQPLESRVDAGYGWLNLGSLQGIRSLHVLSTADRDSELRIRFDGPTVQVPPDTRPLGIMLARVRIDSLSGALPPLSIMLGAAATIGLVWLALTLLHITARRRLVVVLLLAVGLAASAALGRGHVLLMPLWLLLGVSCCLATALIRGETSALMTSWRGIVLLLVAWRAVLSVVAVLALRFSRAVYAYGYDNTFYRGSWLPARPSIWLNVLVDTWIQWDALHYVFIATKGYYYFNQTWPNIAFFPLYPLAIKALLPLTLNHAHGAALLVSHLALLGAALLLFNLLARDWDRLVAYRAIVLLLCFPTSFFLISGYSEALALLLTVVIIWALRRRSYWLAGLAGVLLALTRVPGVLIGVAIAAAFWFQQAPPRRLRPQIIAAALPAAGLGLFMAYQQIRFNTPFAFLEAQKSWDNGSGPPWAIPLALWASLGTKTAEMAVFTLLVWAGVLFLMAYAFRRLPPAYSTTGLLLVPALLAQQPISLTRHVLPVVPLFVALALATAPGRPGRIPVRWALLSAMLALLMAMTALFVGGFFVA